MNLRGFFQKICNLTPPPLQLVTKDHVAKNYCPSSLLSLVNKIFEKLVNKRLVVQLEECDLLSDFQCGFRSSHKTANLFNSSS